MNYKVGDKVKATADYTMEDGERSFTAGKSYVIDGTMGGSYVLTDDYDDEHCMDDYAMEEVFGQNSNYAFDDAMSVI